jgi:hypothetical protein
MPFPIAISSSSFNNLIGAGHLNILTFLELLYSRYKVAFADLTTALLPAERLNPDYLWQIRDFMDERRITLSCLCIDGPVLWSDHPEARQADRQIIFQYLDAARRLGARAVRADFGAQLATGPVNEDVFEEITIACRQFCEICSENNIKFGLENKPGFTQNPSNLQRIKKAVGHPSFGHLLQVGGWKPGSGREMLDVCLPDLIHVRFPAETVIWSKDLIRRIARTDYQGAYCISQNSDLHEIERAEWQLSVIRGITAELEYEGLEPMTPAGYFCQMAKIEPPDGILDI